MKSLKESLFGDNITNDINIDFDFLVKYTQDKVSEAEKKYIIVEMDQNGRGEYEVNFWSNRIKNARKNYEQININFVISRVGDEVIIKPWVVFGVDKTFIFHTSDDHRIISETKGITFDSVSGKNPDVLIKTIDGFFDAFEKINKDKHPIISKPNTYLINNIGRGLFYEKVKKFFKEYPNIKKID